MGLADEIMGLVGDHISAWVVDAHGRSSVPEMDRTERALIARLTEIEQELAALRFFAELGARAAQALPPFALPCTSEYVNAQTGYTGETGG